MLLRENPQFQELPEDYFKRGQNYFSRGPRNNELGCSVGTRRLTSEATREMGDLLDFLDSLLFLYDVYHGVDAKSDGTRTG